MVSQKNENQSFVPYQVVANPVVEEQPVVVLVRQLLH